MRRSQRAAKVSTASTPSRVPSAASGKSSEVEDLTGFHDAYGVADQKPCCAADHANSKGKPGQKKNCAKNPLCLYGLGEHKSGIWTQLEELEVATKAGLTVNKWKERDLGVPCGLNNLGATCYVNALLQTLFHNPQFRSLVYKWSGPASGTGEHALALQKIFVEMEKSTAVSLDLTNFVKLLNLQTGVQQDAQEFNKLLLDHLSAVMDSRLTEMFNGVLEYQTKCKVCNSISARKAQFMELELAIKGMMDVNECLAALQCPEILSGSNQYFCEMCSKKVDAERRIVLVDLPDVLNLQLMRFVFDYSTMNKRKLKDAVNVPETLQVASASSDTPIQYDLQAILYHRGTSAHAGHYIAEVRMNGTEWWTFNDELVERKVTPEAAKKLGKAAKDALPSTKDAYMIVFRKRGTESNPETLVAPPAGLVQEIEKVNEERKIRSHEFEHKRKSLQNLIDERKSLYTAVMGERAWAEKDNIGSGYWIPTSWLEGFITGESRSQSNLPALNSGETVDLVEDKLDTEANCDGPNLFLKEVVHQPFRCVHGKLNPIMAKTQLKLVPPNVWKLFVVDQGVKFDIEMSYEQARCSDCANVTGDELRDAKAKLEKCRLVEQIAAQALPSACEPSKEYLWISKKWIKNLRERTRASIARLNEIISLRSSAESKNKKPKLMDDFVTAPRPEEFQPNGFLNDDIICEHGALVPGRHVKRWILRKDWNNLVQMADGGVWSQQARELPLKESCECAQCVADDNEARAEAKREREERDMLLKDSNCGAALKEFHRRKQGHPGNGPNDLDSTQDRFIVVPRSGCKQVRAYLDCSDEFDDEEFSLKLKSLECPHAGFCISPRAVEFVESGGKDLALFESETSGDDSRGVEIELVTSTEFEALNLVIERANGIEAVEGAKLVVEWNNDKSNAQFVPALCEVCMNALSQAYNASRTTFEDRPIYVTRLAVGQQPPGAANPTRPPSSSSRSTRNGNKRITVTASSADTVYLLKMKIYEAMVGLKCEPSQIRLHHKGKLLDSNSLPLEFAGIRAGDDLYFDTNGNEDDDVTGLGSSETERGFKGTALVSSSSSNQQPATVTTIQISD